MLSGANKQLVTFFAPHNYLTLARISGFLAGLTVITIAKPRQRHDRSLRRI